MKVAGRVAAGYGVLLFLMTALLVYPMTVLNHLQAANRINSGENLKASVRAGQVIRNRDLMEDFVRKYLAGPNPDLLAQIKAGIETIDADISKLEESQITDRQKNEFRRLGQFMKECSRQIQGVLMQLPGTGGEAKPAMPVSLPPMLEESLERVGAQALTVYQLTVESIETQAADARKAGDRAIFVFRVSVAAGLVFGLLTAVLIVRSIASPLRQLTDGSRAIAEGKTFYRLDTSRSDEFSQIARDIHRIAGLDRAPEELPNSMKS
jgi:HAMP domain-containing protein